MINIVTLVNEINYSNCYFITDNEAGKCITIDPGRKNVEYILDEVLKNNLSLDYILLTHSHFDHISGVKDLAEKSKAVIVSSRICSQKIIDPVKNLSYFTIHGNINCPPAGILSEELDNGMLDWNNNTINIFNTPGHSDCSICINIGDFLFTGDTLIRNIRTRVTIPGGKRQDVEKSLKMIFNQFPSDTLVYPGHGESFFLGSQKLNDLL